MAKRTVRRLLNILIALCLVAIVVSAYMIFNHWREYNDASREYENLRDQTAQNVDFAALRAVNPDCVAWLDIPGTTISYPVVQAADNTYYLTRTFGGKTNRAGSIFMDYRNQADFSDRNTIIYGHNLLDGNMFAGLVDFLDDSFFDEHPLILTITEEGVQEWRIVDARRSDTDDRSYRLDLSPEACRDLAQTWRRPPAAWDDNDRILTLSTCTNRSEGERYIVQAVAVENDAPSY